jgi:multidrug efflux pump subunit AcrA (membrane-fusion protein)
MAALLTGWGVNHFQKPGHLDVLTAQSMDMSSMRPPVGAVPVDLQAIRDGELSNIVVYTGTVAAYNEQIVTPRIVGTITSLPVYPGDNVIPGQLLAQLDTAEVGARTSEAVDNASQAEQTAEVALLTHHLHHQAALDQASASSMAATDAVSEAQAEVSADEAAVTDAAAGVNSAMASSTYWKTELPREQKLASAGAVSEQEYQNEQAQASVSYAAVDQAKAKVVEAQKTEDSEKAKVNESIREAAAADAGARMAVADLTVAEAQVSQTLAGAAAAKASEREAQIVQGYARIVSPANGVVTERPVAPGTLVQPGQEILKIEEIDRVRVQANVAVSDISSLKVGSPIEIETQDSGQPKTIYSHVSSIFPSANAETRTAIVEAVVPNGGHALLPGAFVAMKISLGAKTQGLLVPTSSIVTQSGISSLWSVAGSGADAQATYACSVCHMHYSATQAAKLHYRDPMDGGYLLPLSSAALSSRATMLVRLSTVKVVASDGDLTEIEAPDLAPGSKVVAHGQEELTPGAQVTPVRWSASGPIDLPTNAQAEPDQRLYRCEKCGMTFSAADAKKDNFVDPMDGGKLVPIDGDN